MEVTLEKYDDYEIIGSGGITTFNLKPLKIKITGKKATDFMYVEFRFSSSDVTPDPTVQSSVEKHTLSIDFINYNNPLGTGSTLPLSIGSIDNCSIYLHFRVYALSSESDKTLFYTIYSTDLAAEQKENQAKSKKPAKSEKN